MTQIPLKQDIRELKLLERDGWTSVGNNLWTHPHHHGAPLKRSTAVRLTEIADELLGIDECGLVPIEKEPS